MGEVIGFLMAVVIVGSIGYVVFQLGKRRGWF